MGHACWCSRDAGRSAGAGGAGPRRESVASLRRTDRIIEEAFPRFHFVLSDQRSWIMPRVVLGEATMCTLPASNVLLHQSTVGPQLQPPDGRRFRTEPCRAYWRGRPTVLATLKDSKQARFHFSNPLCISRSGLLGPGADCGCTKGAATDSHKKGTSTTMLSGRTLFMLKRILKVSDAIARPLLYVCTNSSRVPYPLRRRPCPRQRGFPYAWSISSDLMGIRRSFPSRDHDQYQNARDQF